MQVGQLLRLGWEGRWLRLLLGLGAGEGSARDHREVPPGRMSRGDTLQVIFLPVFLEFTNPTILSSQNPWT